MATQDPYPDLSQIADPATARNLRLLWDRVNALRGRSGDTTARAGDLNLGSHKITHLHDPSSTTSADATPASYVDRLYGAAATKAALQAGSKTALNVTNLLGKLAEPQKLGIQIIPDNEPLPSVVLAQEGEVIEWKGALYYFDVSTNPGTWVLLGAAASLVSDTHANRILLYDPTKQPLNLLFYETDRGVIYQNILVAGIKTWVYLIGQMRGTLALDATAIGDQRPIDLGTTDANFRYEGTNKWEHYRWNGVAWDLLPYEFPRRNLVKNGSFEWWETWTLGGGGPISDPTYWTKSAGVQRADRITVGVFDGNFAVVLTNLAGQAATLSQPLFFPINATVNSGVRGFPVTASAILQTTNSHRARLFLDDGITVDYSPYHSGGNTQQRLEVVKSVSLAATYLTVGIQIDAGPVLDVDIDNLVAVFGLVPVLTEDAAAEDRRPYPYRAHVHNSGDQTIANASSTVLSFDTVDVDKGNCLTGGSTLTIPTGGGGQPGLWLVVGQIDWAPNGTGSRSAEITRNGSLIAQVIHQAADATTTTRIQVSALVVDPSDADQFQLLGLQTSGGGLAARGGAMTFFTAVRVI